MPVRIPVIEMIEIGAGGGSIASVDRLGRLNVGPQSAGSKPGPAAFGYGGQDATVTDADVALGFIDPEVFAEGQLDVDITAAEHAIRRGVGAPLGLPLREAADAIAQIVDESMASAGRMHAVESGKELSERTMIAFGGNGPLHATRVARRAGVSRIIVPRDPGVGSAVGFLFAPISFEIVRSRYATFETLDPSDHNGFVNAMLAEAEAVVRLGAPEAALNTRRTAFMRYRGQGHELEVELPCRDLSGDDLPALRAAFEQQYSLQYSRPVPGMTIEILNWAVSVSTAAPDISRTAVIPRAQQIESATTKRIACDLSGELIDARVFARCDLVAGDVVQGPGLIVEPQTTTLVSRDFVARVDGDGSLVLMREPDLSDRCRDTARSKTTHAELSKEST